MYKCLLQQCTHDHCLQEHFAHNILSCTQEQRARALRYLRLEMGLDLKDMGRNVPINFTMEEINLYSQRFRSLDTDNKGYITVNDLRNYFKVSLSSVYRSERLVYYLRNICIFIRHESLKLKFQLLTHSIFPSHCLGMT